MGRPYEGHEYAHRLLSPSHIHILTLFSLSLISADFTFERCALLLLSDLSGCVAVKPTQSRRLQRSHVGDVGYPFLQHFFDARLPPGNNYHIQVRPHPIEVRR
jgi:hypothetical protein